MLRAAGVALALVAGVAAPTAHPLLIAHNMRPDSIQPGEEAVESLVLMAPDGVRLSVREREPWTLPLEARGAWHAVRRLRGDGLVVWRFAAPFTSWATGRHRTPALVVTWWDGAGESRDTLVDGRWVTATSPLPSKARTLHPAVAEGPMPPPSTRTTQLAVIPFILMVLSGLAWWRGGTSGTDAAALARPEALPPGVWAGRIRAAMAQAVDTPGPAAEEVARLARLHPLAVAAGVRPLHTTVEAVALVEAATDPHAPEAGQATVPVSAAPVSLSGVLLLADAVKFGDARPTTEVVVRAGEAVVEAFGDA